MSSAHSPICGSSSDISSPLCAVAAEAEPAPHHQRLVGLDREEPLPGEERLRQRLAGQRGELRLGVEQLDLARTPGEEDEDAVLGPGREVRRPRGERVCAGRTPAASTPSPAKKREHRRRTQAARGAGQEAAAMQGEGVVSDVGSHAGSTLGGDSRRDELVEIQEASARPPPTRPPPAARRPVAADLAHRPPADRPPPRGRRRTGLGAPRGPRPSSARFLRRSGLGPGTSRKAWRMRSSRPPRHSRTTRSPRARAHSAKAGSFSSVRAWSGVFDRSRRGQAALGSAAVEVLEHRVSERPLDVHVHAPAVAVGPSARGHQPLALELGPVEQRVGQGGLDARARPARPRAAR